MIRSITAPNPGPYTLDGTRTWLVGDDVVIDPGPAIAQHVDAIVAAQPNLKTVLITHRHGDHAPAAVPLRQKTGARVFAPDGVLPDTDRILGDGDMIETSYGAIEVIATPGHTREHVCYLTTDGDLFTGDTILGFGTTTIFPPDGNMADYMASLRKLRDRAPKTIRPAHGPDRTDAVALIEEYIRVKKIITRDNQVIVDTSAKDSAVQNEVFKEYKSQLDSAKRLLNGDIAKVNQIISVGWGWDSLYKPYEWKIYIASPTLKDTLLQMYRYLKNYSKLQDSVKKMNSSKDTAQFLARLRKWTTPGMTTPKNLDSMLRYITAFARTNAIPSVKDRQRDSLRIALTLQKWVKDSISDLSVKVIRVEKLENIKGKKDLLIAGYRHYDVLESVWYVLKNMWRGTAFFGFLLTAFAISLGAPFWFDLLNKLIKIRSAGKKEETGVTTENTPSVPSPKAAVEAPAQTTVNVKTQKAPGEEAVG